MIYENLNFVKICGPNPEQYDVFDGDKQIAYVRLRWGTLTCETPNVGGEIIYRHRFNCGGKGMFETQVERNMYLSEIAKSLKEHFDKKNSSCDNFVDNQPITQSIFQMQEIGW